MKNNIKPLIILLILAAFTACFTFPDNWGQYFTALLGMIIFWFCMMAAMFKFGK